MNGGLWPLRTWSRSGPVVPFVAASDSVWHEPHGVAPLLSLPLVKIALASGAAPVWPPPPPAAPPPPPPPPPPDAAALVLRTHALNCGAVITCAVWRMNACPRPQSSAQTIWCGPTAEAFGVT